MISLIFLVLIFLFIGVTHDTYHKEVYLMDRLVLANKPPKVTLDKIVARRLRANPCSLPQLLWSYEILGLHSSSIILLSNACSLCGPWEYNQEMHKPCARRLRFKLSSQHPMATTPNKRPTKASEFVDISILRCYTTQTIKPTKHPPSPHRLNLALYSWISQHPTNKVIWHLKAYMQVE